MEEHSSSGMLAFLEHMSREDKKRFPRKGHLAFNITHYPRDNSYRASMGEFDGEIYIPYSCHNSAQVPDGKTIDDVILDEMNSLGEKVAYFHIFKNSQLYKKAVTSFKMPKEYPS